MLVDPTFDAALARAWARTSRGLAQWDDPHAGEPPPDECYSRVTSPERWRILGARVDAWLVVLHELGRASIGRAAANDDAWESSPGPVLARTDIATPTQPGALALAIGRSRLGPCPDAGVVIGVGTPAMQIDLMPDCGCHACDRGSGPELEQLDELFAAVITVQFRFLLDRRHSITVGLDGARSWGGVSHHLSSDDVDAILAAPETPPGWRQWRGVPWRGSRDSSQRTPR